VRCRAASSPTGVAAPPVVVQIGAAGGTSAAAAGDRHMTGRHMTTGAEGLAGRHCRRAGARA
jgi:hypothetical protein